ncbi:MAG: hypothetical protein AAF226_05575, partial [Verrucomicrobiota bacterium]
AARVVDSHLASSETLALAQDSHRHALDYASYVAKLKHPTALDRGSASWRAYSANQEIAKSWLKNERLQRDSQALRQAAEDFDSNQTLSLPWLTHTVGGIGAGWDLAVPLDSRYIEIALPLAAAKASDLSRLKIARVDYVDAESTNKNYQSLWQRGSASKLSFEKAQLGFKTAKKVFDIEKQKTAIARAELEVLKQIAGITDVKQPTLPTNLTEFYRETLKAAEACPKTYLGVIRSGKDLFHAVAVEQSATAEMQHRQTILGRLRKTSNRTKEEIENHSLRLAKAEALIEWAKNQQLEHVLECQQWLAFHQQLDTTDTRGFTVPSSVAKLMEPVAAMRRELREMESDAGQLQHRFRHGVDAELNSLHRRGSAFAFEVSRSHRDLAIALGNWESRIQAATAAEREQGLAAVMSESQRFIGGEDLFQGLSEQARLAAAEIAIQNMTADQGRLRRLAAELEAQKHASAEIKRLHNRGLATGWHLASAETQIRLAEVKLSQERARTDTAFEMRLLYQQLGGAVQDRKKASNLPQEMVTAQ